MQPSLFFKQIVKEYIQTVAAYSHTVRVDAYEQFSDAPAKAEIKPCRAQTS